MRTAEGISLSIIDDLVMKRVYDKCRSSGGCLVWCGSMSKKVGGYGRINISGRLYGVHRVAWTHKNGEIQDGEVVLHSCDNPLCCNTDHMSVGSQLDNVTDMHSKGRAIKASPKKGASSPLASLSDVEIREIRSLYIKYDKVFGGGPLSAKYGVSPATISRVVNLKRYSDE